MKKGIRNLSLTAIIFAVLSFISVCIVSVVAVFMLLAENSSVSFTETLALIPLGTLLKVLTVITLAILTLIFTSKTKIGIWSEIVLIVCTIGLLPILNLLFSFLDSMRTTTLMRYGATGLYVTVTYLNNIPTILIGMCTGFILVVCGMSIANKIYLKKSELSDI